MEQDLSQKIAERILSLPPQVQSAIQSLDLEKKIHGVAQENGLHIDQTQSLVDETMLVMLGFSDPNEFNAQLVSRLHIDTQTAEKLVEAVGAAVFVPIQEAIKATTSTNKEAQGEHVPPTLESGMPNADHMLTEHTVTTAQTTAPKTPTTPTASIPPRPSAYSADPYREPTN